jgi:hypothetical protein
MTPDNMAARIEVGRRAMWAFVKAREHRGSQAGRSRILSGVFAAYALQMKEAFESKNPVDWQAALMIPKPVK